MGIIKTLAKGAAKKAAAAEKTKKAIAKRKAIEASKAKKARELKENQKKPINELMSQTPADRAEAGMGTASKTRIKRGEIAGRLSGAKKEYKRTLHKIENDPNLSDEQMEIMLGKLRDLEKRYGKGPLGASDMMRGGMVKKNNGSTDYRKGGMVLSVKDNKRGK